MAGRIALYSPGLLRLKHEIGVMTGLAPEFRVLSAGGCDAVAGWGHKPTASRARAIAARSGKPYVAFEDGFLRSLRPGQAQKPSAMVIDRSGIYYDARSPSDLETLLETAEFTPEECASARELLTAIATHRLSKYNHGGDALPEGLLSEKRPVVLVIDQTLGDESVAGGLSDASSFERMAEAALGENPGARVIAKLHPETLGGTKPGYLKRVAERLGLEVLATHVSPWAFFDLKPRVYTVSSQFGFEALLAGCQVACFGAPFYAGWGLTDDRLALARRSRRRTPDELAAAAYLRYSRYFDAWTREPTAALTAVDQLAFLRRQYIGNARPVIAYRIARWKRRAVAAMLDGPNGPPRFVNDLVRALADAKSNAADIAAWGIAAQRLRDRLQGEGVGCIAIEDGFIRSAGLGAAFVQPLSLVFDRSGLYYDPTRPSDIETMLARDEIGPSECARAEALRQKIVADRVTKYNVSAPAAVPRLPSDRETVLVPGQVADDWAVLTGRPRGFPQADNVNAVLLARARQRNPLAFVIFKPHPDVEHLGRAGALDGNRDTRLADLIASNTPLDSLLPLVSRVETYSSLSGFEALLRGVPVVVHGLPFYAGWGLSEDLESIPRRGRKRTLDEMVAVALLRYPRYWDPESGLACPPELVLRRIAAAREQPGTWRRRLGRLAGRAVILGRRMMRVAGGTRHGG